MSNYTITFTNSYYSILDYNHRIIINKNNNTVDFIKDLSKKPQIYTYRYNEIFNEAQNEIFENIFFQNSKKDFNYLFNKLLERINKNSVYC